MRLRYLRHGRVSISNIMRRILLLLLAVVFMASCAEEKSFVIIQVADSQLGFDAAVKGQEPGAEYVNDLTYEAEYLRKAVAEINEIRPDAVVFTGDQVHLPDNQEQWDLFQEIISGIDESIKVLHVPGNHDVSFAQGYMDPTPFTSRFGDDRFVYRTDGVAVVGINTNLIKFDDPSEEEQFEWLHDALTKENDSDVTLVFGHHPFFGENIDEEDGYFQIQKTKRHSYFDLFKEKGVAAVYAGHLHDSREAEYEGIQMTTTTSSAYQLGAGQPSVRVITVKDGKVSDTLHVL